MCIRDRLYRYETPEAWGIATNKLYRWKENAEKQKAGISLSEDERSELKGLRQEVKTLRVEKEILKKASLDVLSDSDGFIFAANSRVAYR